MTTIQAVLIKDISFTSFEGIERTIPAGQAIEVVQLKTPLVSTCIGGKRALELVGTFVGTQGVDSFDIEQDEFKTVD